MKHKFLMIGCMVMYSMTIFASNLPEVIMQSPVLSALTGYVVQNIAHQITSGCTLNPFVKHTSTSNEQELDLIGLQCMGASVYVYRKYVKNQFELNKEEKDDPIYDIARSTQQKIYTFDHACAYISYREKDIYEDDDTEESGVMLTLDLKPIQSGLMGAVLFSSLSWLMTHEVVS